MSAEESADDPRDLEIWQQLFQMYQLPPGSPPHRRIRPIDICLRDSASNLIRRITKIVPYPDGGFALLSPYHPSKKGLAVRHKTAYGKGVCTIPWSEAIKYSASDRVKLSLHPDGFTQFSGEKNRRILSGRDPKTGEPRGLGVMANPFNHPVYTGPTFALVIWGLGDYPVWNPPATRSLLLFEPDEVYFDEPQANGYSIEGFHFPAPWFLPHIRVDGSEASARRMTLPLWRYHSKGSRLWHFSVPPGVGAPYIVVGLRVTRHEVRTNVPSGFVLHGPAERGTDPVRWILTAFYPPPVIGIKPDASLDFLAPSE
jgi:hypothetical protein